MANSKRSDRSKSSVDYAAFAQEEADDDFASGTPPAPKRQKKESKSKRESRKKKRPAFSDSDSDELVVFDVGGPAKKSVNRKSLDEKVFDRDLQMAMELSKEVSGMQESEADGAQTKIVVHDNKVKEEIKESEKENKHPLPEPSAGKEKVEKPVKSSCIQDDIGGIEVLEAEVIDPGVGGRQRRKAASKAAKKWTNSDEETDISNDDSDDDFKGEDFAEDEDEDEDEDFPVEDDAADSDFDAKPAKVQKGKKEKVTAKAEKNSKQKSSPRVRKEKTSKAPSKSIVTPKVVKSTPKTSSLKGFSSPSLTTNSASLVAKKVGTTPTLGTRRMTGLSPAVGGGSSAISSLRSPSSNNLLSPSGGGGLRIGLSRNIRSKPLHANVKAPH